VLLALGVALSGAGVVRADPLPPITAPALGHFWTVLAQGEGQTDAPTDFAAYELNHQVPPTFTDQQPLYAGIMPHAASLTAADLPTYYKDGDFGSMPGGVGSVLEPRPGVTIVRDKRFGMAHIWGDSRPNVMWAAGYATAQERLFLMDVLRHTAEGTSAALLGPGSAADDASQLTDQDFSAPELTDQFARLPQRFGSDGLQAQKDIIAYVDGINAWIQHVDGTPTDLPAEYVALGVHPEPWTVADTAALATMLITQFTISNGGEEVNAALELAFRARFGSNWRRFYDDFREANRGCAGRSGARPGRTSRCWRCSTLGMRPVPSDWTPTATTSTTRARPWR
jgi:hypothetical protein